MWNFMYNQSDIYTIMIIIHIFSLFSQEDDPSFLEALLYFLGLEKRVYKCRSGNDVWKVCLIHTYPLPFHKWRLRCQSLDLHLYGLKPIYKLLILKLSNANSLEASIFSIHLSFIYMYFIFQMKVVALFFIVFACIGIYNKILSFRIPLQRLVIFTLICILPYMFVVCSLQPLILLIIIELVWIVLILMEPSRPLRKIKVYITLCI